MSAHYGYGGQAGKDALIFAYDTGDTENSYKGEPTTNLSTITLSQMGTDGSGQGSVGTRTILSPNHVRIVDINSNTRQSQIINGLTGGTTYTISVEFKKITGTPTFRFQIQNYLNGAYQSTIKFTNTAETGIVDKEGWQTASWTFTLGAGMNGVRIWYQDGADYTTYTHSFELRNPQLEAKAHPTPYTPPGTTRSATQGLLDLTGNNTISLNSSTFDSNAQIDLDGTNTSIYPGTISAASGLSEVTFETVVRSNANNKNILLTAGNAILLHYGRAGFYLVSSDGTASGYLGWNSEIAGGTGVYEHLAATWDGSTMKLYVNGQKITYDRSFSGGTSGVLKPFNNTTLGGYFNSTQPNFNGNIDVAKIYNRALTAAEIKNNYNNYKGRFNI